MFKLTTTDFNCWIDSVPSCSVYYSIVEWLNWAKVALVAYPDVAKIFSRIVVRTICVCMSWWWWTHFLLFICQKQTVRSSNKNQTNLAKGRIAVASHLYMPDGSIGLTVWLQFAMVCYQTPSQNLWTPQVYLLKCNLHLSNGLRWGH